MSFGTLLIITSAGTSQEAEIARPTITIGSAADCDIVLIDPLAAAVHAQIASDARGSEFMLLVDSPATRVDGRSVTRGQVVALRPISRIFVGETSLVFQRAIAPAQRAPGVTPRLNAAAAQVVAPVLPPAPAQDAPADTGPQIVMTLKERPPSEIVKTDQSISYVVEVLNRSQLVDAALLSVEGIPTNWVTILPPRRQLHIGQAGQFELRVRPPRAAASVAETYPLRIVARFDTQKSISTSDERLIEVEPFDDFKIEPLDPESRRAWRNASYLFTIRNDSNHPQFFTLRGRERERAIDFAFIPPSVTLRPGHRQEVQVLAGFAREHRRLFGDRKDYNFVVDATPEQATGTATGRLADQSAKPALRVSGSLTQQPPLSQWVSLLALGFTLLSCLCVALAVVLARFAPDLYNRSFAPVVGAVLPATNTPSPTLALPTLALPTEPPPPTLVPPTPPPTQDVEAAFAPRKTELANELNAKKTEIAGQSDDQKTALALQYAITATVIAMSQAQASTSAAQTSAAQMAEQQTQFSQTQTAFSLYATQTQIAIPTNTPTPTPSETPLPTATSRADIELGFASIQGTPVAVRTELNGNEYLNNGVSICFFGLEEPTDSAYPIEINAADVARCRPPQNTNSDGELKAYSPVLYPAFPTQQAINSAQPFITADQGQNEFRDNLFGVITLLEDATDVRINIYHAGPATVTYHVDALDASGAVIGTAEQNLGVPGPYTLSVTAPQAIRQVIISGQRVGDETTFLQGPLLITRVEVNHRRR